MSASMGLAGRMAGALLDSKLTPLRIICEAAFLNLGYCILIVVTADAGRCIFTECASKYNFSGFRYNTCP
jgi:hypothetical protein